MAFVTAFENDSGPVVDTCYGPVRGSRRDTVDNWRGIRYAAPPVGAARWRRARPPEPWTEPVDATAFGPVCPQVSIPLLRLGQTRQDEDCLFLNVWSPAGAAESGDRMPVLVWVHGGGYVFGAASQPLYDGTALVEQAREAGTPLIVVSLNYRMGALGFADLTSLDDGDGFDTNCGLSDVIAALDWVRRCIAAFGGDPAQVTVFGESAGASIITTLLTSPAAVGLFARAIAQSSPATSVYGPERAAMHSALLMRELGLRPDESSMLRRVSSTELARISAALFDAVPTNKPGTIAYGPVIDGDLVPVHPLDAYLDGTVDPVPLLIGTNHDETTLFKWMKSPLMPVTPDEVDRMFGLIEEEHPELELPAPEAIAHAYRRRRGKSRSMAISRDLGFRLPTLWLAEGHSTRAPVHVYRFDWASPLLRATGLGAAHATELPYVWGNPLAERRDIAFRLDGAAGDRVGSRMRSRWISYAVSGDPTAGPDEPTWERYTPEHPASLVIDKDDVPVVDLDARLLDTWGRGVLTFR